MRTHRIRYRLISQASGSTIPPTAYRSLPFRAGVAVPRVHRLIPVPSHRGRSSHLPLTGRRDAAGVVGRYWVEMLTLSNSAVEAIASLAAFSMFLAITLFTSVTADFAAFSIVSRIYICIRTVSRGPQLRQL